jgi:hypothetical protein
MEKEQGQNYLDEIEQEETKENNEPKKEDASELLGKQFEFFQRNFSDTTEMETATDTCPICLAPSNNYLRNVTFLFIKFRRYYNF